MNHVGRLVFRIALVWGLSLTIPACGGTLMLPKAIVPDLIYGDVQAVSPLLPERMGNLISKKYTYDSLYSTQKPLNVNIKPEFSSTTEVTWFQDRPQGRFVSRSKGGVTWIAQAPGDYQVTAFAVAQDPSLPEADVAHFVITVKGGAITRVE